MKRVRVPEVRQAVILVSVSLFTALEAVAVALYPGGTWWDARTTGYSFWQNYLCDMTQSRAIDGSENLVGSVLARTGMLVLLAGLTAFWLAIGAVIPARRLSAMARFSGLLSVAGVLAVVVMPSDRFGRAHGMAVVVAAVPGMLASALALAGLLLGGKRTRTAAWLNAVWLVTALGDFAFYAVHFAARDQGTPLLPALQKVAIVALMSWMTAVATLGSRPLQMRPWWRL